MIIFTKYDIFSNEYLQMVNQVSLKIMQVIQKYDFISIHLG